MAGTYWLTILPDTSKLKPAINAAMRGQKITADFGVDPKQARKAGEQAAKTAEQAADKTKPKIKPTADKASAQKAGTDSGKTVSSAFRTAANGDKLGAEVGGGMAAGLKRSLAGVGALVGGAAIFGGLKASIAEGMDFTTSLNVMAGVSRATADQIQQVSAAARQLGSDATLPGVSATTAAQAMTELAKGGFNVQQSMDAARGTLQLAGAAGIDAASAATIQADALHAFGLSAKDAGYAADVLANVANASTGEITDFAAGFAQSGAVASQFGMTIDDTAAALGALANQGIKGSDAGTLLKSSLLAITDQGNPAQGAIKQLGLTLYDAEGRFVGMRSMMDQLGQAAKRMSPEVYQAATNTLFGSDAARLAGVAAKEGASGFDVLKEAVNRQGGAADMATARTKGLPGAWAQFQNTVDGVKLSVYDMVQGPLTSLLTTLTGLPDWVSRNSDALKIMAAAIGTVLVPAFTLWIAAQTKALAMSIVSGIGGILGAWGSIAGGIASATAAASTYVIVIARTVAASVLAGLSSMVAAFRSLAIGTRLAAGAQMALNLAMSLNPIGLIIAAVVAVGVALWAFFTKTETGRKMWATIWGAIKAVAGAVFDWLKNAVQVVGEKISYLWNNVAKPAFEGIGNVISTMWNGVKVVWDGFTNTLQTVGDKVVAFKDGLVRAFNAVKDVVGAVWDKIGGIIEKIGNGIGKVGDFLKGAGGTVLNALGLGGGATGGYVVSRYASGGKIAGPGSGVSDSILGFPAMVRVSNGEYIVNADSTRKYLPLLQALNTGSLPGLAGGGLTPHATEMKSTISRMFGVSDIGGYREPDGYNEHSTGNALDVMIPDSMTEQGKALGNSIAAWALKNADAIGLTGVIWRQTSYGYGNGFGPNGTPMEDRGSPTANHFDHVHLFMNEKPDTSLTLSGAPSMSSSVGSATSASGGSYRAATDSELSASSGRVDSANKAVTQAQQSVDDKTFNRDQSQKRLDKAKAEGKDTTAEEESLRRNERELNEATQNLTEKRQKAADAETADSELRTNGKLDTSSGGSGGSSGAGGMNGSDFGQMFVSGLMESIGLDGSVFSNPLEWPSVKSAMAGVNFLGGLASSRGGGGGESAGGFAAGAADSVGLGGLLSAIPNAVNGSPVLAPGEFNPAVAGGTAAAGASSMSTFAPDAAHGGGGGLPGPVDNSININGPVGMNPADVRNQIHSEQNSRTRTTKVN